MALAERARLAFGAGRHDEAQALAASAAAAVDGRQLRDQPTNAFVFAARTHALVRLGALIALDAPVVSYQSLRRPGTGAGATADEILDTLVAVAPITGGVRVVASAPALAEAIGDDIDAALEAYEDDHHRRGCAS